MDINEHTVLRINRYQVRYNGDEDTWDVYRPGREKPSKRRVYAAYDILEAVTRAVALSNSEQPEMGMVLDADDLHAALEECRR